MRSSPVHRLAGLAAGLGLLLSIGVAAAQAKEGVEVTLAAPISGDAQPGETVAIFFRLSAISDAGSKPLHGSDVFIRLYGPTGATTQAAGREQSTAGTYRALIEIPAGGAARAEFGLRGFSTNTADASARSDLIWPYDGLLVMGAVPPAPAQPRIDPAAGASPARQPATTTASATTTDPAVAGGFDPRVALVVVLGAGLAGAAGLVLGRRRRVHGAPA